MADKNNPASSATLAPFYTLGQNFTKSVAAVAPDVDSGAAENSETSQGIHFFKPVQPLKKYPLNSFLGPRKTHRPSAPDVP
jgi:hypothetical protein